MKICMVVPFFYPHTGGTEKYVKDLSTSLVNDGHEVTVISTNLPAEKNAPAEEMMSGFKVIRLPADLKLSYIPVTKKKFDLKMLEGYEKRNRIISEYAPYQVRFKTENMEEISKLLKIRDIPKSLEKIPIIPEIVIEKEDTGKFENTVDIPLWAYEILKRSGDVWTEKEMIFPIADIKYDYEYGTKINENHSADII